jgi:hypothetical protein
LEIIENWLFTICVADIHFFKILLLIVIWASSCVLPTLTLTVSEAIQQRILRRTNAGVTFRFQSRIVAHRENFIHHLIFALPQHTSSAQFEDLQKELNLTVKDLVTPEFLLSPLSSILNRIISFRQIMSRGFLKIYTSLYRKSVIIQIRTEEIGHFVAYAGNSGKR